MPAGHSAKPSTPSGREEGLRSPPARPQRPASTALQQSQQQPQTAQPRHCPAHPSQAPQSSPGQPAGQALVITTDAPVHNTSSPAAASAHPLPLRHKNPSYPRADRKGAWGTTARTRFTPAIRSRDPKTPKGFTTRAHLDHSSTNNFRRLSEQCNHRWRHLQQEKKIALVRSFARPNNTVLGVRGSTTSPR